MNVLWVKDDVAEVVPPSIQVTSLRSYGIARRGLGIPPGIHQAKELLARCGIRYSLSSKARHSCRK
jgi:hypothetical protein